jgi:zinc transport system substrate-binding protein
MHTRKSFLIIFFVLMSLCVLTGYGLQKDEQPDERISESGKSEIRVRTFVSILPYASFVERIGGDFVHVEVLVKPGSNPHLFEPTPRQMVALGEADVYFGIGFPFEERIMKKVKGANPNLLFVKTDEGISRRPLDAPLSRIEEMDAHRHEHEAGILDPHIWLSYREILVQAKNITKGLSAADPAHEAAYKKNFDRFTDELERVHKRLKKLFEPYRGRSFIVFHPAFGYFADTYGLVQVPIEIEGKSPTPRQIELLIEHARGKNVNIIFVSPQFDKKSAQTIADAIGGAVISINPLEKDVLQNLETIAEKIETALR